MKFEFISLEDAGNKFDYIVRLRLVPDNWRDRLLRRHEKELTFYGHDDSWHTIDMTRMNPRITNVRTRMWRAHGPPAESKSREGPNRRPACKSVESTKVTPTSTPADLVDEALDESFPASDPTCWTGSAI